MIRSSNEVMSSGTAFSLWDGIPEYEGTAQPMQVAIYTPVFDDKNNVYRQRVYMSTFFTDYLKDNGGQVTVEVSYQAGADYQILKDLWKRIFVNDWKRITGYSAIEAQPGVAVGQYSDIYLTHQVYGSVSYDVKPNSKPLAFDFTFITPLAQSQQFINILLTAYAMYPGGPKPTVNLADSPWLFAMSDE